ncbi:MAG: F-type H+-transporting ATPase subunit b [Frankiaceae bacterium]|nr:F-type H+-transporting ATPase subunit b [Frankiaceae bacterium]
MPYHLILWAQAHGTAETEPVDKFNPTTPHGGEIIAAAIFFLLLFAIIVKVALPKLNATLAAREQALSGQLTEAERVRSEADQVLAEYRARLADAQSEANRIIEEGRRTQEAIIGDARTRAEAEAQALLQRAQSDIQAERDRALAALRSELASLSIELAGKVVGQSLNTEAQRALVEGYIDQLASRN